MFLCCWRIILVCLALKLVGSWAGLVFSVGIEVFWMSSCQLMFPGVRSFLEFSSFRLKPPASMFQSSCYSGLKTSPSLLSKRMGYLSGCLVSSVSFQTLFCGICSAFKWSFNEFVGEEVFSLSYSSAILGLLPVFIFLDSKITADGDHSLEIKRCLLLARKVITNLDSVLKSRHHFANQALYNQNYGFSSSHVGMWELDYKEGWMQKNWCFQIVVLEKTLENPVNCKDSKQSTL